VSRLFRGAALLLLSVALSVAGLLLAGGPQAFRVPDDMPALQMDGVLLAGAALVAWWVLAGWRTAQLARAEGYSLPVSVGVRALFISLFAAAVTPAAAGSSFGFVWFLSRSAPMRVAAAVAVYGLALDMGFVAWSVPVSLLILKVKQVDLGVPGLTVVALLVAAGALFIGHFMTTQTYRLKYLAFAILRRLGAKRVARSAVRFIRSTHLSLGKLRQAPWRVRVKLHLATALGFACHFLAFNGIGVAFRIPFDHLSLGASQALVSAVGMLVPTPGGSGFYELALHQVFVASGAAVTMVAPLVALWRLLSFYLYLVLGPLALLGQKRVSLASSSP
jgi:uncharacterized protein (TIRG00374 family)